MDTYGYWIRAVPDRSVASSVWAIMHVSLWDCNCVVLCETFTFIGSDSQCILGQTAGVGFAWRARPISFMAGYWPKSRDHQACAIEAGE